MSFGQDLSFISRKILQKTLSCKNWLFELSEKKILLITLLLLIILLKAIHFRLANKLFRNPKKIFLFHCTKISLNHSGILNTFALAFSRLSLFLKNECQILNLPAEIKTLKCEAVYSKCRLKCFKFLDK